MGRYDFLLETYDTERLKTLGVWSQVPDDRMRFRPEPAQEPAQATGGRCRTLSTRSAAEFATGRSCEDLGPRRWQYRARETWPSGLRQQS